MPVEIKETVIMLDHDLGEVRVDTSYPPMMKKLVRLGFVPIPSKANGLYARFMGRPDQIVIRKGKRIVSEKVRKAAAKRLAQGRADGKEKKS